MARQAKTKTLQVRVDQSTADKVAAIARARGIAESELLRLTIQDMLRDAEKNVDVLKARLLKEFKEKSAALDALASGVGDSETTAEQKKAGAGGA